jgi:hypothetical protein
VAVAFEVGTTIVVGGGAIERSARATAGGGVAARATALTLGSVLLMAAGDLLREAPATEARSEIFGLSQMSVESYVRAI